MFVHPPAPLWGHQAVGPACCSLRELQFQVSNAASLLSASCCKLLKSPRGVGSPKPAIYHPQIAC
eukprot:2614067-Pyramimonas_sp.AAC.1